MRVGRPRERGLEMVAGVTACAVAGVLGGTAETGFIQAAMDLDEPIRDFKRDGDRPPPLVERGMPPLL